MKLKSFMKVCNSVDTRFTVFKGEEYVESFSVNYLGDDRNTLNKAILKRMDYEKQGAEINWVDIINGHMCVDIRV